MKQLLYSLSICLLLFSCNLSTTPSTPASALELKVDSLIQPYLDSAQIAGVAIAVVKQHLESRGNYLFV